MAKGLGNDVLADRYQLPAQVQVVDRSAVMLGIDDGDGSFGQARQVLSAADLGERAVLVEEAFQRHRIGDLPALDQLADSREDPAVHGIAEMLGREELGDAAVGGIVDEDGA